MLGAFMGIGVIATLMMATIDRGEWQYAAIIFIVANIAIAASFVFYDSLLPHIAAPDEMDRVSTSGYAIGYLGGGIVLVVNLLWILMPETFGIPGHGGRDQAVLRERCGLVAGVLDPALQVRAGASAGRPRESTRARDTWCDRGSLRSCERSTSCAATGRRS